MQQDPPAGPTVPQAGPTGQPAVPPPRPPQEDTSSAPQAGFYQPATPSTYVAPPAVYAPQPQPAAQAVSYTDADGISWEASEYIHNAKGAVWAVGLCVIAAAGLAVAIWLQTWTLALLIVVMAVAMGYMAFRKPHVMQYRLTDAGIQINNKIYHYEDFRAFGILEDGAFYIMTLLPTKRLSPAISVYFAEEQGEQIVDIISRYLPMEDIKADPIDTLMRRLRF